MRLKNNEIYRYGKSLSLFNNYNAKLPIRIGFYLQKNLQIMMQAAEEIEVARLEIAARFGTINADGTGYDIPTENLTEVNHELKDLFDLEQELPIHIFKLDEFEGIELTYQQLSAIMFMIEE